MTKSIKTMLTVIVTLAIANQFLMTGMLWKMFYVPLAQAVELTGNPEVDAQILVFSKGMPHMYGKELGINADIKTIDVSTSIEALPDMAGGC